MAGSTSVHGAAPAAPPVTAAAFIDPRKTALIISEALGGELENLAEAGGLRSLGVVAAADASSRLERTASVDLLLVDARTPLWSEGLCALLTRFDEMARMGVAALVVLSDAGTVDPVFAAVEASSAQLLCDAEPSDIAAAIALAVAAQSLPLSANVRDIGRESEAARLARLSDEVSRLARLIAGQGGFGLPAERAEASPPDAFLDRRTGYRGEPEAAAGKGESPPVTAGRIRRLLRQRRLRDQMFPEGLFADPAWDMLLDLTAARLERSEVSVSSLCIAAAVPSTTALRWIRNLTEQGIFERRADFQDGRRVFVTLSDSAFAAMNSYFAAAARIEAAG